MIVESAAITSLKAVEAASQSSAAGAATAPSMPSAPAPAEATEQFRAMMDAAKISPSGNAGGIPRQSHSRGEAAFGQAVATQDNEMSSIKGDVDQLQKDAPTMSMEEYTAAQVKLQYRMAEMTTSVELGVGFAQGGKGAVQNLMKNS